MTTIEMIILTLLVLAIIDLSYGLGYVNSYLDIVDGKLEIDE